MIEVKGDPPLRICCKDGSVISVRGRMLVCRVKIQGGLYNDMLGTARGDPAV